MGAGAVLAIDQGTTNTKALLFDSGGGILARGSASAPMEHPRPGWAQQDAGAIWQSVEQAIAQVCRASAGIDVLAIGISNQRESALLWDRATGAPLGPCISWQCRRTTDACLLLERQGYGEEILAATGLKLDPLFSAGKIAWLLDNIPGARDRAEKGELCAGTIDGWILHNLTGIHATDHSNASRTQLMCLQTGQWHGRMLDIFRIPASVLPAIRHSSAGFGATLNGQTALPGGIPVGAVLGDSHAALLGHGIDAGGRVKVTIGTGSSLMVTTGENIPVSGSLSNTVAWSGADGCTFALEGNIAISGHAVAYAAALLGIADERALTELAASVKDSGGVRFVPALAGIGAPHWRPEARGVLCGMSLSTSPAHIARATFEAIALQINDVFQQMEAGLGHRLASLSVDGGAAKNDLLLQLLADVLDRDIERVGCAEASALGAARMAARTMGTDIAVPAPDARFSPGMEPAQRQSLLESWRWGVALACQPALQGGHTA